MLLLLLVLAQDPLQLGRQALAGGRLDEAETHLQAALAANPPRVFEVHYALGRLYLQKRDYARARESFEASLTRAPRFSPAYVGRARAALFLGDMEGGLADLKTARGLPEAPPEAELLEKDVELYVTRGANAEIAPIRELSSAREYLRAGVFLLARQKESEALRALRIASAIDDQNPVSFLALAERGEPAPDLYPDLPSEFQGARQAFEAGDLDKASAAAEGIVRRRALFVPARLLLVEAALSEKRLVDALVRLDELASALPPVLELHARAARVALEAEAYELAECSASSALALEPSDPALVFVLAQAQLDAGKADAAVATCERAIAAGAASAPIYFVLGNALHGKMEIAGSIAALSKAVELDPQAAEDIASFALSSLTTEDYRSLRSLLEAHVETHRDNVNTLYSLGVMSLREGELEKAQGYFERVRDLAPRDGQAYYNLALLHQRAGREDLAREAMARFEEIEADEERLWQEGHRLSDLRIRAQSAEPGEKVEILTKLVAIPNAETPDDYVLLGDALLAAGRLEEAREAFTKGRTQKARDRAALDGLTRVSEALGEKDRAAAYAKAAALLSRRCP
jgi:tetratricopeptide (TPR) repeat protein